MRNVIRVEGFKIPSMLAQFDLLSLGKNDNHAFLNPPSIWLGFGLCSIDVKKECYLVDPASSHMLVSKIKPCMCKYELIQTVKLRMAH